MVKKILWVDPNHFYLPKTRPAHFAGFFLLCYAIQVNYQTTTYVRKLLNRVYRVFQSTTFYCACACAIVDLIKNLISDNKVTYSYVLSTTSQHPAFLQISDIF